MTFNTLHSRALRRAFIEPTHDEQDHSLTYMLLLLLLLVFGPIIGVHVTFVLESEQASAQRVQHKEAGRDRNS